jgi:hypothetical protein
MEVGVDDITNKDGVNLAVGAERPLHEEGSEHRGRGEP